MVWLITSHFSLYIIYMFAFKTISSFFFFFYSVGRSICYFALSLRQGSRSFSNIDSLSKMCFQFCWMCLHHSSHFRTLLECVYVCVFIYSRCMCVLYGLQFLYFDHFQCVAYIIYSNEYIYILCGSVK